MKSTLRNSRVRGGAMFLLILILSFSVGIVVTYFMEQTFVQSRATRVRVESLRALEMGYGELEKAKTVIGDAAYDIKGHNLAIREALATPDKKIAGTEAVVAPLTGDDGTWYSLTVTVPYADTDRIVRQVVREIDFFSSYNLFVANHPAGISGSPIGAVHSNEDIQFYFPDGFYRDSLTCVKGVTYKAGATTENTSISGTFHPDAERIEIDYADSERFNLDFIESNATPDFKFDDTHYLKIKLYGQTGQQWARIEKWSKPQVLTKEGNVLVGYDYVNPHSEDYTYNVKIHDGWEEATKTITNKVWVELTSMSGGTSVGGDSGYMGYWKDEAVQQTYLKEIFHYETMSGTHIVYDKIPKYEWKTYTEYGPSAMVSAEEKQLPSNGLLFTQGEIKALYGNVVGRLTIAARGSINITGDLQYRDGEGDTAYKNGKTPWLPYEPNPDYSNRATLGLIAYKDVMLMRSVPDNLEINASMLAVTGRVGIDGVELSSSGDITSFNKFFDQWGKPVTDTFSKNSIRRLGGITTSLRPVETVIKDGTIKSGFNVGRAIFDIGLLEGPPPFFLPYPVPRFFNTVLVR